MKVVSTFALNVGSTVGSSIGVSSTMAVHASGTKREGGPQNKAAGIHGRTHGFIGPTDSLSSHKSTDMGALELKFEIWKALAEHYPKTINSLAVRR